MTRLRLPALLLGLALAAFASLAMAQKATDPAPLQFRDEVEETRFHALVAELRCVMCQNQSLADSDAQIARDLRREVLDLMRQGRSDGEIREFLVDRYGDFVLYRPKVEGKTLALWFGPLLLVLAGAFVLWRLLRPRPDAAPVPAPSDDQEW
jgi:cytochrome c-type biogenesis protein CcmH